MTPNVVRFIVRSAWISRLMPFSFAVPATRKRPGPSRLMTIGALSSNRLLICELARRQGPAGTTGRSCDDGFRFQMGLKAEYATFATDARLFKPAKRNIGFGVCVINLDSTRV